MAMATTPAARCHGRPLTSRSKAATGLVARAPCSITACRAQRQFRMIPNASSSQESESTSPTRSRKNCWASCTCPRLAMPGFDPGMAQTLHPALQRVADFVEHLGILDGGRHAPAFAVGDLLDGAAQDLAGARLRQPADRDRELEGCDGPKLVAHQRHDLFFDLGR